MDNSLEEQSERASMSENTSCFEECSKAAEVYADNSNQNCAPTNSAVEFMKINDRNEDGCSEAGTAACDKDTEKCDVVDLLVKLGNDTAVYNISKSLERVRYIINTISVEDILSSGILPHQRCVTYISEAQKTIKGNQKGNVFKFVSSYPSGYNLKKKHRVRTGVPVIIIGDVTNIQEDHCSYVFVCAYMNEIPAVSGNGMYNMSGDESSSDSSDDGSSTADSSEDSSSSDFSSSDEDEDEINENSNKNVKISESVKPAVVNVRNPLVFLEDGAADKLPPVRECDIKVPKQDCIEIGYVMHIHELLVSVQGLKDSPALNSDTLLFLEDSQDDTSLQSLGFIYEVIGPVGEPVYCITFKEEQSIEKKQVKQGAPVYISPSSEHTHFVFVQDLLKQKGSDASWKNDVEPPEQFLEYSDDEEERLAKQRMKQASSKEPSSNAAVKRKDTEENNQETSQVRKRKRVIRNNVEANDVDNGCQQPVGPQVHSGTTASPQGRTGAHRVIGRGQRTSRVTQVNVEVGNRNMQSTVPPPGTSNYQHNGIGSYCATGRGQQMNREVGNRRMPQQTSDNHQSSIGSYCATGRGQQMNREVGNRHMPQWTSDNQQSNIGSYCVAGRGQRALNAVQMNSAQPPRMQHYGLGMQPAGLAAVRQPPPRMQQYTSAPAVNRHFMPVPPAAFPSNRHLSPPLRPQQQAYFNPRCIPPFPPPQGQFCNPPQ